MSTTETEGSHNNSDLDQDSQEEASKKQKNVADMDEESCEASGSSAGIEASGKTPAIVTDGSEMYEEKPKSASTKPISEETESDDLMPRVESRARVVAMTSETGATMEETADKKKRGNLATREDTSGSRNVAKDGGDRRSFTGQNVASAPVDKDQPEGQHRGDLNGNSVVGTESPDGGSENQRKRRDTVNESVLSHETQRTRQDDVIFKGNVGEISLPDSSVVLPSQQNIAFQQTGGELPAIIQTIQHPHSFGYSVHMMPSTVPQVPQHILTAPPVPSSGRRKIVLHLQEEVYERKRGFFFGRRSSRSLGPMQTVRTRVFDRGSVTVSWFEGTTSMELQGHVRRSVIRKLGLGRETELVDMRIIDESVDPPEEIVLSPFIPDGSQFLLQFHLGNKGRSNKADSGVRPDFSAPGSPSALPSPFPSNADLNAHLLAGKLRDLQPNVEKSNFSNLGDSSFNQQTNSGDVSPRFMADSASKASDLNDGDVMGYNPEDQVEARLRELAELLIVDRRARKKFSARRRQEKRQVIFVLANYFVLFLSLIALSAEIQARAPRWLDWVEAQLQNVQKCATDQDALFECVSKGDFSGLIASFILWVSRSAATKRFFLFGFESPKRLWTVVYESMVTAVCWGTSYIVIRRGMNPDTRKNFLRKYWKDAVYGSLAGFNASFMKQVLKNLIPQEALEDALQERQLKILSWLPNFNPR